MVTSYKVAHVTVAPSKNTQFKWSKVIWNLIEHYNISFARFFGWEHYCKIMHGGTTISFTAAIMMCSYIAFDRHRKIFQKPVMVHNL